jgi:hypothetical protein
VIGIWRLDSTVLKARTSRNIWPRVRGSVDENFLQGDIKVKGILWLNSFNRNLAEGSQEYKLSKEERFLQ